MMVEICEADVKAVLGNADEFVLRELIRTEASILELRRALQFVKGSSAKDVNAYGALPTRMRRLVDLLSVGLDDAGVVQSERGRSHRAA